jgi:2-oxoglutarate dehydrogenase E2 component (dihydrolipoamide succinyltransferase)
MSIEVKVPQLPESVTDATLVAWHKKAGEAVSRDENLVDLETDKVVLEVPAPSAGVIKELKVENGATVTSGQVLAILEEGASAAAAKPAAAAPEPKAAAAAEQKVAAAAKLAPAAKRMVEEHKLDAGQISGSGRDGRISKGDVIQHMAGKEAAPAKTAKPTPVATRRSSRRRTA